MTRHLDVRLGPRRAHPRGGQGLETRQDAVASPWRRWIEFLTADLANTLRLLLLIATVAVGAGVVALRALVLPAKFSFDSEVIQLVASGKLTGLNDQSFDNVAAVYRFFDLQAHPTVAGMLGYVLAVVALISVLVVHRWRVNWPGTAALVLTILMSAVYVGTYSKDVFVLPLVLLALWLPANIIGEAVLVVGLLSYADIFRTYWYLVAAVYVLARLAVRLSRRRWVLLVLPFVVLAALAFVLPVLWGHPSDFARTQVNEYRGDSANATTMIRPFVDMPEPWASLANTSLVLVSIVVPVPLMIRGGSYYLLSGVAIIALWAAFFAGFRHVRVGSRSIRLAAFVIAFITTQALFEPDYGSVVRHLTPVLPLLCAIALMHRRAEVESAGERVSPTGWLRLGRLRPGTEPNAEMQES